MSLYPKRPGEPIGCSSKKGEAIGGSFDWVPYPAKVTCTIVSASLSTGFVLASIVQNQAAMPPEIYVHEIGRNTGQIDPSSITFPRMTSVGEIALLAMEPLGLALAVIGSDPSLRSTLWVGRFDGQGKEIGTPFNRFISDGDSVERLEDVHILPAKNGGWVCYWKEI
jgi:hypothetical protein